jgi:hypothetical protein
MGSHYESHGNDFEHHFKGVNDQEYVVDGVSFLCDEVYLFVYGQEEAVYNNDNQNEPIEPWVDSYYLDHLVSKGVCYREAAQRYRGIVLLVGILASYVNVCSRVSWEGFTHVLHLLVSKLA